MTLERTLFGWKWWLAYAGVALVLVAGGCYFLVRSFALPTASADETNGPPPRSAAVRVEVVHPRKGDMERTSVQPGSIHSFETVQLYAGVSGYLKTLNVDIGDRITKGQVLARVDVPDLGKEVQRHAAAHDQAVARVAQMKARVTSAKADVKAAEAGVVQAQAAAKSARAAERFREQQLRRMKDLFALKSIDERLVDEKTEQRDAAQEARRAAEAAIETAKAQLSAAAAKVQQAEADVVEAEAEVKVAEAQLERSQVLVQFATITAPFDGVVTQRNVFPGDFIRAATEGGSHVPVLTVERTDLMRVVVQVPDRDVPYADPGDRALVEIDALPGKKFEAKISRMARSEDPQTRLMRVEIDLPNPTGKISQGMYGHVTIVLEQSDLVSVPTSCLVSSSGDGQATVYVVRDGRARLTPIQLGSDNGLNVAIKRGLKPEDQVVLHPGKGLADGVAVSVTAAARRAGTAPRR